MVDGFLVRQVSVDDFDQILVLERNIFGVDAWPREVLLRELFFEHSNYWVLVDSKGLIVGYCGVRYVVGDVCADVQTLAVDTAFRGLGLGRFLIEAALDFCSFCNDGLGVDIFLEVAADNVTAQGLYDSLGFERLRVLSNYYGSGCDAFVMFRRGLVNSNLSSSSLVN